MPIQPLTPSEFNKKMFDKKKGQPLDNSQALEDKSTRIMSSPDNLADNSTDNSMVGIIDTEMFVVKDTNKGDSDMIRRALPSRGFFYKNKKDISHRSLKVKDLNKIQLYLKRDEITYLIDAVQDCITPRNVGDEDQIIDVRDLTLDDFFTLVFYIASSSYKDLEIKVEWESLYRNRNLFLVKPIHFSVNMLDVEKLRTLNIDWKTTKFFPCSVRSYEYYSLNKFVEGEEGRWSEEQTELYWNVARFLKFDDPNEQLEYASDMDINSEEFLNLKKFIELSKHDLVCSFKTFDKLFEPRKALERLKEISSLINKLDGTSYETLLKDENAKRVLDINLINSEIQRIQRNLDEGKEVSAVEETVPFRATVEDFVQPLFL